MRLLSILKDVIQHESITLHIFRLKSCEKIIPSVIKAQTSSFVTSLKLAQREKSETGGWSHRNTIAISEFVLKITFLSLLQLIFIFENLKRRFFNNRVTIVHFNATALIKVNKDMTYCTRPMIKKYQFPMVLLYFRKDKVHGIWISKILL